MKAVKSTRSMRSIRSAKSGKYERVFGNDVHSLGNMLVMACAKFSCPYAIAVIREVKQDEFYKSLKQGESKVRPKRISLMNQNKPQETDNIEPDVPAQTPSITDVSSIQVNSIPVTMIYDNYNTLTEIKLANVKQLPQILLRIINLLLPFYRNIVKFTITNCTINMYTIYELGKMLEVSTITEICLDGSFLIGDDYTMLLGSTNLKSLSLSRCKVSDEACKLIATKLHHGATADNLSLLNLSTNRISDEGAKYLGFSLRSNRRLRYLNLSDNHISDFGAGYILDVLIEFPLTKTELLDLRERHLAFLKRKESLYLKYLVEYCRQSNGNESQISRKLASKKKKSSTTTIKSKSSARKEKERSNSTVATEDLIKAKAAIMTAEVIGQFEDPFQSDSTELIDGCSYCLGNMTLAYLNLAYNNLSYITVKKLRKVLLYQNASKKINRTGLIKVVLDGNNLPINCAKMTHINDLMVRKIMPQSTKSPDSTRRKSRMLQM